MDLRDTIRTYRLFSGSYDFVFGPVFHPGRKEAVRVANDRPGQRILEVGVGTGLSFDDDDAPNGARSRRSGSIPWSVSNEWFRRRRELVITLSRDSVTCLRMGITL